MVSGKKNKRQTRNKQKYFSVRKKLTIKQEGQCFLAVVRKKIKQTLDRDVCLVCAFKGTNSWCLKKDGCYTNDYNFNFHYVFLARHFYSKRRF